MGDSFQLDEEPIRLTDVAGFRAGAAACGLADGGPDVGVLLCETAAKMSWTDFLGSLGKRSASAPGAAVHGAGGAVFSPRAVQA